MIPSTLYYEALFDDEDHVCLGENKYANATVRCDDRIRDESEFVTLNAIKPGRTRADANVAKYRNFLIEMDDNTLDEQKAYRKQVEMPYTTAVFTGGKSIHFVLSLYNPLPDEETYRAMWRSIEFVFKNVGCTVDSKCKNPSRFTRVPGYRKDKKQDQVLLKVNERVPNHEVFAWLRRNGVDSIDQFRPKPPVESVVKHTTADDDERFEHAVRLMGHDSYESGNKNAYQYKLALRCKAVGFSERDAEALIERYCGVLDKRNPVHNAYKISVENINVLSKADYKAMKAIEKLNKIS